MARLYLQKTLNGFTAGDEATSEAMRKYKVGETYRAEVSKPRNLTMHRRYWALVTLCYQNSDQFKSAEQCHEYLKIRAGHCEPIASKTTGEVFLVPKSIAFSEMDDVGFAEFWNKVVQVICEEIIPGLDSDALELEIQRCAGLAA